MTNQDSFVTTPPTKGEARVRTKFNVTANGNVDVIKQESAKLIDFCEDGIADAELRDDKNDWWKGETIRLWSLAQTAYEEAAMWAVKASTH